MRPSALPALAMCSAFAASTKENEAMQSGTDRHTALAEVLRGEGSMINLIPNDEREAVEWAANYIRLTAPMHDHPLILEQKVDVFRGTTKIMEGTPDARCANHLFDLKWRDRNYREQMAAYALGIMQAGRQGPITVHILFAERQFVEQWDITLQEAQDIVYGIADKAIVPTPCEYCDWCEKAATCPALTCRALEVASKALEMEVLPVNWLVLSDPHTASQALELADAVATWADAVKVRVKELMSEGTMVPGWMLKSRAGARTITDPHSAQLALGFTTVDFLDCCSVAIGKLEKKYAENYNMKGPEAKAAMTRLLADSTTQRQPTVYLERTK